MQYTIKYLFQCAMAIGLIVFMTAVGYSQDIYVEAEVSSQKVTLGSTIQFTITIHGNSNIGPIQLPPIDGFEARYLGPSTRVSYVNGQQSSSKSFIYSLLPLREGKFQIPTFEFMISGKVYTIHSVPLEVVASMGGAGSVTGDQATSLQEKLFVVLKVPKEEVYLNESLPMKVLIFISGLSVRDIQYPDLNNIGFSIGEYTKPQQYQQIVNGMRFTIVEFNTKVYPSRVGDLQLGPAKIAGNLIIPSSRGSSRFGRNNIFDDDFFNSFFDRHEKRPVVLESKGVNIKVLPLPQEGKPNNFSGAVGQYNFNVSISPNNVKEGDPITLRMTILGKGNLSAIQMPSLSIEDNFKIYDPQIFEKDDIKKSEQVIIPLSEDITEIPVIRFSYFDPQLKIYRTITKGPFPIKVAKLKDEERFKVVGLNGEYRPFEFEKFGEDIVFIKARPGKFQMFGQHVYNSSLFYYISPQVWAWKKNRVYFIKNNVDQMLVLFPFEVDFYAQFGIDVYCVGHPLIDIIQVRIPKENYLPSLGLSSEILTIGILPGSRQKEIEVLLPIMLTTAKKLISNFPEIQFLILKAPTIPKSSLEHYLEGSTLTYRIIEDDTYDGINACNLCMVASGTATLEVAILQKPMVIVYKTSLLTWILAKLVVKIKNIGLVNVVAGKRIVPECVQFQATGTKIAEELKNIFTNEPKIAEIKINLKGVKESLGLGGASQRAAEKILKP